MQNKDNRDENSLEIIYRLINYDARNLEKAINAEGDNVLIQAIKAEDLEVVNLLLMHMGNNSITDQQWNRIKIVAPGLSHHDTIMISALNAIEKALMNFMHFRRETYDKLWEEWREKKRNKNNSTTSDIAKTTPNTTNTENIKPSTGGTTPQITNSENIPSTVSTSKSEAVPNKKATKKTTEFFGVEEQEQAIRDFLENAKLDSDSPHFLIVTGPPGTGKTKLIEKVTKECGYECKAWPKGDREDKWVNQLETRAKEFFDKAKEEIRQNGKPIYLWMDEIDAVCTEFHGKAQNHNPDAVVALIQTEIDKLREREPGTQPLVLIGATNYPDRIKRAVMDRAGHPVVFKLPNRENRIKTLAANLDGYQYDAKMFDKVIDATAGWSPRVLAGFATLLKDKARKNKTQNTITDANFIENFKFKREMVKQEYKDMVVEPPKLIINKNIDDYENQIAAFPHLKKPFHALKKFMSNPNKYTKVLPDIRRHILLYGPPGTGKTSFARELAASCHAMFIALEAGNLDHDKLEKAFKEAGDRYEKVFIFIDEIDKVASSYSNLREHLQTLMDGFDKRTGEDKVLVVIGATNHRDKMAKSMLDRFTQQVAVPLPTLQQRAEVFKYLLLLLKSRDKDVKLQDLLENDVENSCKKLAELTDGFSQRDIKFVIDNTTSELIDETETEDKICITLERLLAAINAKKRDLQINTPSQKATTSETKETQKNSAENSSAKVLIEEQRKDIFKSHLEEFQNNNIDLDMTLDNSKKEDINSASNKLAQLTEGFSPEDITSLMENTLKREITQTSRNDTPHISLHKIMDAIEVKKQELRSKNTPKTSATSSVPSANNSAPLATRTPPPPRNNIAKTSVTPPSSSGASKLPSAVKKPAVPSKTSPTSSANNINFFHATRATGTPNSTPPPDNTAISTRFTRINSNKPPPVGAT